MLLLLAISLIIINSAVVSACSCAIPPPPLKALNMSDAVFAGKIIDLDPITFSVSSVWKGAEYETIILLSDATTCGFNFAENKEYLVYAHKPGRSRVSNPLITGEKLTTNICTRTKLLADANEDLQELGEGKVPTKSGANMDNIPSSNVGPNYFLIAALGFAILVIVWLIIKRKK